MTIIATITAIFTQLELELQLQLQLQLQQLQLEDLIFLPPLCFFIMYMKQKGNGCTNRSILVSFEFKPVDKKSN